MFSTSFSIASEVLEDFFLCYLLNINNKDVHIFLSKIILANHDIIQILTIVKLFTITVYALTQLLYI